MSRDPFGEEGGANLYLCVGNDPINWIDPFGLKTLVILNESTSGQGNGRFGRNSSGNPFGHIALAVEGHGIYSFGNSTDLGSSVVDYLTREAQRRNSTVFELDTTPEQEQKILEFLKQFKSRDALTYPDNCAGRTRDALIAGGIGLKVDDIIIDPSGLALSFTTLPDSFPAKVFTAVSTSPIKKTQFAIPRNSLVPPERFRIYEPKP